MSFAQAKGNGKLFCYVYYLFDPKHLKEYTTTIISSRIYEDKKRFTSKFY